MAKYRVLSLHANVVCGDCAIHLLLDENDTIHSGVLIDGGATKSGQTPTVIRLIDWINKNPNFKYPTGQNTFQLDTIVVSHWVCNIES